MNKPEDTQTQLKGDGNSNGESTLQVVKAFRSVVKNVVQVAGDLVVRVPGWGVIAAAVVGIVLIVAMAFLISHTLKKVSEDLTLCRFNN